MRKSVRVNMPASRLVFHTSLHADPQVEAGVNQKISYGLVLGFIQAIAFHDNDAHTNECAAAAVMLHTTFRCLYLVHAHRLA